MKHIVLTSMVAGLGLAMSVASGPALAADSDTFTAKPAVVSDCGAGKKAIDAKEFTKAIRLFAKVVKKDAKNADAYNYLGFAYRNTGKLKLAMVSYRQALSINPGHKGALEYQGEMFLKLNRIEDAKANFRRLQKACPSGCEELADLKHDIAGYIAARGPKAVAKPGL